MFHNIAYSAAIRQVIDHRYGLALLPREWPFRHPDSKRRNVTTLQLNGGGTLEFDDRGSGPAIVFLHGWSLGKEAFAKQRRELSDRFRVIVPDMRGHGNSKRFEKGDGIDTLARDLERLFVALDLTDVILVGWSMGALVAWQAAKGPQRDRIRGIVTIDMVPRVLNGDGWQHGLRAGTHLYDIDIDLTRMRDDWRAFTQAYVPMVFADGKAIERRELIDEMLELVADNDLESMMNLWHALVHADYVDTVQRLDVPTLITYGALSQIYSEEAAAWMDEHIPLSRRVCFVESGHAPHLEEPQRFNQALADFTGELEQQSND
jgi:pimeloyl-ACP methyl ester carboxylesterase